MIAKLLKYFKKSPLLAFIKFEPTFLTGSLAVCLSAPVPAFTQEFRSGRQGEAGGRWCGLCPSARRVQPVPFGYFQTDTAIKRSEIEGGKHANCLACARTRNAERYFASSRRAKPQARPAKNFSEEKFICRRALYPSIF